MKVNAEIRMEKIKHEYAYEHGKGKGHEHSPYPCPRPFPFLFPCPRPVFVSVMSMVMWPCLFRQTTFQDMGMDIYMKNLNELYTKKTSC